MGGMVRFVRLTALFGAVSVLAACGAGSGGPGATAGADAPGAASSSSTASGSGGEPIAVVASTNVWGDIAAQIGGSRVTVTSLIHDLSQDAHSFEPSGRDELAVARAKVVIVNGGGYDDFLDQMLHAVSPRPTVVDAVTVASAAVRIDPDNEHIWFDLEAVGAVAQAIERALTQADPAGRADFESGEAKFISGLAPIRQALDRIAQRDRQAPITVTEPLPLYLTAAAGLKNVMPASFSDAVEEGIDVAPSEMAGVLTLFTDHRVRLLVYNEQSTSAQTTQVLAAAKSNGIPVLSLTEIIPAGEHYQQWMAGIVESLGTMLAQRAGQ
jgi:zinc/manganese transport system substrate-binding protein